MSIAELPIAIDPEAVAAFCHDRGIRKLSLFGSVLRDDFGPDSDVDVLIVLEDAAPWDLFDWVDMIDELKTIFGREVDLVEKTAIVNPFRRRHILDTHEVVYAA